MIGYYDYTVILTYISLLSAAAGTLITMQGLGHPYIGVTCLLISGLCDTFDGRVARSKKDRDEDQKLYGVMIDSLSDLVAFGVLPAGIGVAMLRIHKRTAPPAKFIFRLFQNDLTIFEVVFVAGCMLYILTALIRLAYFNVLEINRQQKTPEQKPYFKGVPVTTSALVFPVVIVTTAALGVQTATVYLVVLVITAILFITPIKIPKPGFTALLIFVGIGVVEFIFLLMVWFID